MTEDRIVEIVLERQARETAREEALDALLEWFTANREALDLALDYACRLPEDRYQPVTPFGGTNE